METEVYGANKAEPLIGRLAARISRALNDVTFGHICIIASCYAQYFTLDHILVGLPIMLYPPMLLPPSIL
jgi:hypothetical protein